MAEIKQMTLPYDVLELIVNEVYDTDSPDTYDALRNLSVTSKLFLPLCRAHLYNSIELQMTTSGSTSLNNLAAIIRRNPSIGSLVKHLVLFMPSGVHPPYSPDCNGVEIFSTLLRSFKNVENLLLKKLDWKRHDENILEALRKFISQPSIRLLDFQSSKEIPFSTLVFPPSLQQLIICDSTSKGSPSKSNNRDLATTPIAHIAELHLELLSNSTVECLIEETNVELDRLTALNFTSAYENNAGALRRLFRLADQSLRDLEIHMIDPSCAYWLQDIDIFNLESVENISLYIFSNGSHYLHAISRFFDTASDKNSISTIEINVDLSNITEESVEWGYIHNVLAGQKFRNLRCIRVVFNTTFGDRKAFEGYLLRRFPELSNRGIFSIVFKMESF